MAIYTVHVKQGIPGVDDRRRAAIDAVFLRDGFSPAAFVFGPFWLLANRLWLAALVYAALAVTLAFVATVLHLPPAAASLLTLLLNLLLGLEARNLVREKLERRGFAAVKVVQGTKLDDAERRFFAAWQPEAEPITERALPSQPSQGPWTTSVPSVRRDDVVGLFPEKGGHQ
ncbi:MAG: DUF2628 domain-containing protein [Beijerinckiaceae bacterium]|nr:DUF2628 domain-containing protein [Beijerinckiaceae bacterium]